MIKVLDFRDWTRTGAFFLTGELGSMPMRATIKYQEALILQIFIFFGKVALAPRIK